MFPLLPQGGRNILQITDAKYRDVLLAYAMVVGDLCNAVAILDPDGTSEQPQPRVASSDYSWFEPICFSLIALLIQCEFTHLHPGRGKLNTSR